MILDNPISLIVVMPQGLASRQPEKNSLSSLGMKTVSRNRSCAHNLHPVPEKKLARH